MCLTAMVALHALNAGVPRTHEWQALMGYSMRDARFRLTEWRNRGTSVVVARELYDYQEDPRESVNRAERPELQGQIAAMSAQITRIAGRRRD